MIALAQHAFLIYGVLVFGMYTLLNLLALGWLHRHTDLRNYLLNEVRLTGHEPGMSIIVPAYNEGPAIVSSVRSLLQQEYGDFEVIVVNDGSRDDTLANLREAFDLYDFPHAYHVRFPCKPVRGIYRSRREHRLRVIDKENGGSKADAANAGLNLATRPLFCVMDADSVLDRRALLRTAQFFLDDRRVVACGGTLRPLNGCRVEGGNLVKDDLPRRPLALFQTVEYLRSFLCGRIGWAQLNGLLIISGGYGVFRTEVAALAGGFDSNTLGEDMDLVLRIHATMLRNRTDYRLAFVPETTCWTEVPETLRVFGAQRKRWQRGLAECLWTHRRLFFTRRAFGVGWIAMPFFLFAECLSPIIEVIGLILVLYFAAQGALSVATFTKLTLLALAMSALLSATSLLLDSLTPGNRISPRRIAVLFAATLAEPFVFHPLHTYFRLIGIAQWLFRTRSNWGTMTRSTKWDVK